ETVGKLGRTRHRAHLPNATVSWGASINAVNGLVRLLWPTAEMARVIEAVARGDLSQKMGISIDSGELCGDFLHVREVLNTMVDQLNSFAFEVTRVAHEVGTEGKLGGQASVRGVAGTWKDLTDNVNLMAVDQLNSFASEVTRVAREVGTEGKLGGQASVR